MGAFEDFKVRQEQYLAKAAVRGNKARNDLIFVKEILSFVKELSSFKEQNNRTLDLNKRATIVVWREYWLKFLESSPVKLAA